MQSMQEHDTFPGKIYAVTCASGCTITDNKGRTLGECEAGKQTLVIATSDKLMTSADALVTATFNSAPVKLRLLGLLGGGATNVELPKLAFAGVRSGITTDYVIGEANVPQNVQLGFRMESRVAGKWLTVMGWYLNENWLKRVSLTGSDYAHADNLFEIGWRLGSSSAGWIGLSAELGKYYQIDWINNNFNINGENYHVNKTGDGNTVVNKKIFMASSDCQISYYFARWTYNGEMALDLEPRLTSKGFPCLFDKISGKEYSKDDMVAGFTLKEAKKLGNLPNTGGTLTISLPTGWDSDAEVDAAIKKASSKGWNIEVQQYASEVGTSTFGMRRIWVRKTLNDNGNYVAQDGTRWRVDWCVAMYTPDGSEPDAHGYEMFRSVDAAVDYWELEPYVNPEEEAMYSHERELLTNQEA